VPPAPTHGDLKLEHILLDGDRLTLLDLDGVAGADPILDVARVSAELVAMSLRSPFPPDRARAIARTFVGEYFAHVPEIWGTRLPLHYAGANLKMAVGFFRRQAPGLPGKIEALLKEVEESLGGRVW
jgi:aminoglycoside phosphotransferase (APT) family kinase protein